MKKTIISIVASLTLASSTLVAADKVYATVNGVQITSKDVAIALRDPRIDFTKLPKAQQKQLIQSLVEQELLAQYALKTDVVKSKLYKEELEKLKSKLALQIWMGNIARTIKVSEKELKDVYNKNKDQFKVPAQLKARHILVKTEKEAKELIAQLKKAKDLKKAFIKLAKTKSIGPSKVNGGDLGWFTKAKMVPTFSEAADKLKKGTITTQPVKTQFGYHIIYLEDKKEATIIPLEKIKLKLQNDIAQVKLINKVKAKVQTLTKKAKISIK